MWNYITAWGLGMCNYWYNGEVSVTQAMFSHSPHTTEERFGHWFHSLVQEMLEIFSVFLVRLCFDWNFPITHPCSIKIPWQAVRLTDKVVRKTIFLARYVLSKAQKFLQTRKENLWKADNRNSPSNHWKTRKKDNQDTPLKGKERQSTKPKTKWSCIFNQERHLSK